MICYQTARKNAKLLITIFETSHMCRAGLIYRAFPAFLAEIRYTGGQEELVHRQGRVLVPDNNTRCELDLNTVAGIRGIDIFYSLN